MPPYRNPGPLKFRAKITQSDASGAAAFVDFPYEVEEKFGVKGRVPVRVTFDGIPYRGSLVKMGGENHIPLILKEIRQKLGKKAGDTITVTVKLDEDERKIELATDSARALKKDKGASVAWAKLSYSHQREYHLWIEDAKKPETRERRIAETVKRLKAGTRLKA